AMALFGEKYDDEVRVVTMGKLDKDNKPFSVELCGGTHVKRTGDIGLFKIVSESSLAAGIRRVEAVTGANALAYLNEQDQTVHDVAAILKTSAAADLAEQVKGLINDKKGLEKEVSKLRKQVAMSGGTSDTSNDDVKEINGIKFTSRILSSIPPKDLKPMVDELKKQLGSGVVVLIATGEGKASIVVGVTDDLIGNVSAVDLVRVGSEALGGKGGGGRPDMAQAGGPNESAAPDAVAAIEEKLADT
ncbi:MAG: alanine--tRNA ligase, partial [Alphaproteobacteria bacterium]|nr:alanine--tRNA ligase [Alphaproteobacteria bacterium]